MFNRPYKINTFCFYSLEKVFDVYRGYYTAARRHDFYLRVLKTVFYEGAQRVVKYCF